MFEMGDIADICKLKEKLIQSTSEILHIQLDILRIAARVKRTVEGHVSRSYQINHCDVPCLT